MSGYKGYISILEGKNAIGIGYGPGSNKQYQDFKDAKVSHVYHERTDPPKLLMNRLFYK